MGAWSLLRRSLHLLFDGVPDDIDTATVRQRLLDLGLMPDVTVRVVRSPDTRPRTGRCRVR